MRRTALTEENKETLKAYLDSLRSDECKALADIIKIKNKQGVEIPFKPWPLQERFLKHRGRVNDIIKLRSVGISNLVIALRMMQARLSLYHPEMRNRHATIFCKSDEDTAMMFNNARDMDRSLGKAFVGSKLSDSAKTIHYSDTGWILRVMCSGKTEAAGEAKGRQTVDHYTHITEAGYIENLGSLLSGILGALPVGGEITLESTSSGPRGFFSQHFLGIMQNGKEIDDGVWAWDDRRAFFFGLLDHHEYTLPEPDSFSTQDEEEERLCELGASPGRILWRRRKIEDYGKGIQSRVSPEIKFKRDFPATWQDAFEEAGGAFFKQKTMVMLKDWAKHEFPDPVTVGLYKEESGAVKWSAPANHNRFTIWTPPAKGWLNRYLFFMDCGQGQPGSDFDVGYIGDLLTHRVVAMFQGQLGSDLANENALKLSAYYSNAMISWDVTGIGTENRPGLLKSNYPNIWQRYNPADGVMDPNSYGLLWTKPIRAEAVTLLRDWTAKRIWSLPPSEFFDEQQYFAYKDQDSIKPEAATGFRDDHVMALAGLFYVSQFCGVPRQEVKMGPYEDAGKLSLKKHLKAAKGEDTFKSGLVKRYGR